MTAIDGYNVPGQNDPLFKEGMAFLQSGQWQEAIRCFEALTRQYPDDRYMQEALNEARFKQRLDASVRVRPRRSFVAWRPLLLRLVLLALIVVAVYQAAQVISRQILPPLEQARAERALQLLLDDAETFIQAEEFDRAEANLSAVLEQRPDDARVAELQAQIAEGRERLALYQEGMALKSAGDLPGALDKLSRVVVLWPAYKNVNLQIQEIRDQMGQADLMASARSAVEAGRCQEAMPLLERLRTWNVSYQPSAVEEMLAACYATLAREIIQQNPPDVTALPLARSYLQKTLALRPTNAEATLELTILNQFLDGKQRFDEGYLEPAIQLLRPVFNARPDYQGGEARRMLYEAYYRSGDLLRDAGDCGQAYERYRQACNDLGVRDNVLACERQSSVVACLTPTATPTPTPTATPTPLPTPTPGPTATPTPPPPLATFRNQIVFLSANPDRPGVWVMNPDGSNRRYLGPEDKFRDEIAALREAETWDPARRCRTYTTRGEDDKVAQVYIQCRPDAPGMPAPTWKVSKGLAGLSYDPVWSPDGSRIAFVSDTAGSDDIWVTSPDPANEQHWNYTPNKWEWDKRPSFSPDSRRIVFWSNREGTKQLYIIDADGRNLRKIIDTTWDEYDPLWIK